jgi:hypothetical protein
MARYGNDFERNDGFGRGYGGDYGHEFTAGTRHYNTVHDDWHIDRGQSGYVGYGGGMDRSDWGNDWNGGGQERGGDWNRGRSWQDEGSWGGAGSVGNGWTGGNVHDRQYGYSGYAGRRHDLGGGYDYADDRNRGGWDRGGFEGYGHSIGGGYAGGARGYDRGFGGGGGQARGSDYRGGGYGQGGYGYGGRGGEFERWNQSGYRGASGYGGDYGHRYAEDFGDRVRDGWDHLRDRARGFFRG